MNSLDGIRVLDLSRVLAGPWCTQTLADLGADVIKIERPGTGDDTRTWGPPFLKDAQGQDTAEAAYYLGANRNKRSVVIDLRTPEGKTQAQELLKSADVVIENFRPGVASRLGLGPELRDVRYSAHVVQLHVCYRRVRQPWRTAPARRPSSRRACALPKFWRLIVGLPLRKRRDSQPLKISWKVSTHPKYWCYHHLCIAK